MTEKTVELKILRQNAPGEDPFWEEFSVPYSDGMNVIAALMEIQKNPVNKQGKETSPVVWDCNCLEEICGACTMVVNDRVRQACSALVDDQEQPIKLEPMRKFPTVRDLAVDRSRIFANLKKIKGWVHIDGSHDIGFGPTYSQDRQQKSYALSRCMSCGCCMDACPQYHESSDFMGAAILGQVYYFSLHPIGSIGNEDRLRAVMGCGGVTDCGNAQNCQEVCPKELPLIEAIAQVGRMTSKRMLQDLFSGEKKEF